MLCGCFAIGAEAGTVLYSDLGPQDNPYDSHLGWIVTGSQAFPDSPSVTQAHPFVVDGDGTFSVSEIDLAVVHDGGPNTFTAALWTDLNGLPGSQVSGAFWSLSTNLTSLSGGLISIKDITGVALTGGQRYFMVLGPADLSDDSFNVWDTNNQGVMGDIAFSNDGGKHWTDEGSQVLGAFDILANGDATVPEPSPTVLLGVALIGIAAVNARLSRAKRQAPSESSCADRLRQ